MLAEAAKTAASTVVTALQKASAATGADFDYLLGTAMRESSLKPDAKAGTSSATGLFQFVEQTWLGMVKDFGAKHGLSSYANAITKSSDGRYRVANNDDRSAILRLRNDPQISALMAGEYAKMTASQMEDTLGRKVTKGELYAAHVLGSASACKLIRSSEGAPSSAACNLFPKAAESNPTVFYHSDGSPKSVREVYNWAVSGHSATPVANVSAKTEVPSLVTSNAPDQVATAALMTALWRPMMQQQDFFGTDESSAANAAPFSMSPEVLQVLQTVAQNHGKK